MGDREKKMEERDKQVAFLAQLVYKLLIGESISGDELQALENIMAELPDVKAQDFRW